MIGADYTVIWRRRHVYNTVIHQNDRAWLV
jgi:hypothetical protein